MCCRTTQLVNVTVVIVLKLFKLGFTCYSVCMTDSYCGLSFMNFIVILLDKLPMLLTFSITVVILDYQTPQPCGIVSLSSGHVDAARTIQCAQCMVLLRSSNDDRNSTMHCSSVCSLHFVACRVASRRTFHLIHILLFITFSVEPLHTSRLQDLR